jgi:hypothetical protein
MSSKTAEKYGRKIDFTGSLKYVRLGQREQASLTSIAWPEIPKRWGY